MLLPPKGKVFTGVAMGYELGDFTRRVGRAPQVWEQFVAWDRPYRWAIDLARGANARVMLALSTAPGQDAPGTITPAGIARGHGDDWLLDIRTDLGEAGVPAYVRPMGEMNNCHNAYAPLHCSGVSRGTRYGTTAFVAAWKRITVIMRGTSTKQINGILRRMRQPVLKASPRPLAPARIAMVWSPMTGGAPMVSALDPARSWPGREWVDWIGTSFYSKYPRFTWLSAFYARFAARYRRPFMLAEWAMWENGDPGFVSGVLSFARSRPWVKMLVYNQGKDSAGPFRLRQFPGAAKTLKAGLSGRVFAVPSSR